MLKTFNYLFQYLEKEDISINKSEFEFQIESHPDYPSLVAITDTLHFFNVQNGVLNVKLTEIELLPNHFVALLGIENSQPQFYLVEKKREGYFCFKDKNKTVISNEELELSWKNTVLLVEKSKTDNLVQKNSYLYSWVLPSLCVGLFFLTLMQFHVAITTYYFFVFPILGFLFSVVALKDLFGTKSELLNSFCNVTASSSCESIVGSNKWKIFEIVNFSDLSIIFFSSQFIGLLIFLFAGNITAFFSIQKIMLFCAVPVLLTSVYYQKFVEKKWCPVCLIIIGIILLELPYVLILLESSFDFLTFPIIVFAFIIVTDAFGWLILKKLLNYHKELKEFQLKGKRFMRNYDIFKNSLLASDSIENSYMQLEQTIILGNPEASLKIRMVTNPFCGFCAEAHNIIEQIVDKYSEKVCFDIHFNFNESDDDQKSKKIHKQLVSIYFNHGQQAFMKALHDWFRNKDENDLDIVGNSVIDESKVNLILAEQFNWNKHNGINFTPSIIIKGNFLPKQYDRNDLIHFINDLAEDEDFQSTI